MSFSKRIDMLRHPEKYVKSSPYVSRIEKKEISATKPDPQLLAIYDGWNGVPRRIMDNGGDYFDYMAMRTFALSPTPFRCITRIVSDIVNTECEIVPLAKNAETEPTQEAKDHAKTISNWFFNKPNNNGQSVFSTIASSLFDLISLDAGCLAKEYSMHQSYHLTNIIALDGGRIWIERNRYRRIGKVADVNIDGVLYNNYNVGYWEHPLSGNPIPWEPHEIVYMMENPRTDIPYGSSIIYTLREVIQAAINGDEYYRELGDNGYVGSITISAPQTLTPTVYEAFKARIMDAMRGGSKIRTVPIDSDGAPKPMGFSPKDLMLLESLQAYRDMIIVGFGLTPVDFGYSVSQRGSSPSTVEAGRSNYIRHGLYPRLKNLEWYINTIIQDWFTVEDSVVGEFRHGHVGKFAKKTDDTAINAPVDVAFRFKFYDPVSDLQMLEVQEKELKLGLRDYNSILKARGLPEVPWKKYSPLFLTDPLKFAQGFSYPIVLPKSFKDITGITEDVPPPPQPMPNTTQKQDNDAFKKSRKMDGVEK